MLKKHSNARRKTKKTAKKKPAINMGNWNTTDADEITRRRMRAEIEKFHIRNIESGNPYYSNFSVGTGKGKLYLVEIRSLSSLCNTCSCPDHYGNGLGTCKHVEAVLLYLKKKGVKKFRIAADEGTSRLEIYIDRAAENEVIRVMWPTKMPAVARDIMASRFLSDHSMVDDGDGMDVLLKAVSENKWLKKNTRISQAVAGHLEYKKINSAKAISRKHFLDDARSGKRSMDILKHPLFPYQQDGMLHLAFTERALLADEMGLGKTIQAIAASVLLHRLRQIQRVLVVTTASIKAEWQEQISRFTDLPSLTIFGPRATRLRQYQQEAFFYILNYEQVTMDAPDIQHLLAPDIVILDEAQRIKNWHTKIANTVKTLKSRYAFVLTGTPVENRIDDIYSIVQFLDPRFFGPLFRFNRDYYELDEKGRPAGYKNLDGLYQRLRPLMLCRKKTDVEDELPGRINSQHFVSMEPEQRLRYEEYEKRVAKIVQVAKHRPLRKEEFERLQKWLACMRMLCDTPYILDRDCRISPKLHKLESILEEQLASPETKVIIFSEWARMLDLVREMAHGNDWDLAWHTGSVPQQQRRKEIQRFKSDRNCRLFLSTDAGSLGLNLQVANVVINLDLPWNPAKLEQRIARAWRKNQMRPVRAINLVCENTIEHRMLFLLEQKQLLANGILIGEGDLKSMKMPSGRAAFMERMDALMGGGDIQPPIPVQQPAPSVPTRGVQEKILAVLDSQPGSNIGLMQLYGEAGQPPSRLLVVSDSPDGLCEKLLEAASENNFQLETVDRKTMETIERLVSAGILNYSTPVATLYDSSSEASLQRVRKRQLSEAEKFISQAQRKQKMARVLSDSDFREEAIVSLKHAIECTLRAHLFLSGKEHPALPESFQPEDLRGKLSGLQENTRGIVPLFLDILEKPEGDTGMLIQKHQTIMQDVGAEIMQASMKSNIKAEMT